MSDQDQESDGVRTGLQERAVAQRAWPGHSTFQENIRGEWIPAIPVPLYALGKKRCACGESFWTAEGYRAHYALRHILDPESGAS